MAVEKKRAPAYLKQGYKKSHKTWRVDGPPGTNNLQREHWDGRLDARVSPRTVSAKISVQNKER